MQTTLPQCFDSSGTGNTPETSGSSLPGIEAWSETIIRSLEWMELHWMHVGEGVVCSWDEYSQSCMLSAQSSEKGCPKKDEKWIQDAQRGTVPKKEMGWREWQGPLWVPSKHKQGFQGCSWVSKRGQVGTFSEHYQQLSLIDWLIDWLIDLEALLLVCLPLEVLILSCPISALISSLLCKITTCCLLSTGKFQKTEPGYVLLLPVPVWVGWMPSPHWKWQ